MFHFPSLFFGSMDGACTLSYSFLVPEDKNVTIKRSCAKFEIACVYVAYF